MIKDLLIDFYNKTKIYHNKIIIFIVIFISFYFIFDQYFLKKEITEDVKVNDPIVANYKSDMNFIECIAEQHSCLYNNLKNKTDHKKIIEVCKNEIFCSNPIIVSIPK
jgi:hypothetical protein